MCVCVGVCRVSCRVIVVCIRKKVDPGKGDGGGCKKQTIVSILCIPFRRRQWMCVCVRACGVVVIETHLFAHKTIGFNRQIGLYDLNDCYSQTHSRHPFICDTSTLHCILPICVSPTYVYACRDDDIYPNKTANFLTCRPLLLPIYRIAYRTKIAPVYTSIINCVSYSNIYPMTCWIIRSIN